MSNLLGTAWSSQTTSSLSSLAPYVAAIRACRRLHGSRNPALLVTAVVLHGNQRKKRQMRSSTCQGCRIRLLPPARTAMS
eukprot:765047-Hanusia_phi.AAC.7